jgi:hypothetical protein
MAHLIESTTEIYTISGDDLRHGPGIRRSPLTVSTRVEGLGRAHGGDDVTDGLGGGDGSSLVGDQ